MGERKGLVGGWVQSENSAQEQREVEKGGVTRKGVHGCFGITLDMIK